MPFWSSKKAIDPVCGMQVDEKKAVASYQYHGKTYYFCAMGCRNNFQKDPEKYLSAPKPQGMDAGAGDAAAKHAGHMHNGH